MSNGDPVEELAWAIDHIDRAEQLADSEVSRK